MRCGGGACRCRPSVPSCPVPGVLTPCLPLGACPRRLFVISRCKALKVLDFRKIKLAEREEAERVFGGGVPAPAAAATFEPDEELAQAQAAVAEPEAQAIRKGPSAEQMTVRADSRGPGAPSGGHAGGIVTWAAPKLLPLPLTLARRRPSRPRSPTRRRWRRCGGWRMRSRRGTCLPKCKWARAATALRRWRRAEARTALCYRARCLYPPFSANSTSFRFPQQAERKAWEKRAA